MMEIKVTAKAKKQLRKCPGHIRDKFDYWCDLIGHVGLEKSRRYGGFRDEALRGKRKGQRSIRLSRSYRVIYRKTDDGRCEIIEVLEVNKHEY